MLNSPGLHFLQDPRTGVYNFDSNLLQGIPRPEEFAYDRVAPYSKPSTHAELANLAKANKCAYAGSTSTLTKALSQIYFLISGQSPLVACLITMLIHLLGGKPVDISSFSGAFTSEVGRLNSSPSMILSHAQRNDFSFGCHLPACLEITKNEDGVWFIDSDKSYDNENVLSEYVRQNVELAFFYADPSDRV